MWDGEKMKNKMEKMNHDRKFAKARLFFFFSRFACLVCLMVDDISPTPPPLEHGRAGPPALPAVHGGGEGARPLRARVTLALVVLVLGVLLLRGARARGSRRLAARDPDPRAVPVPARNQGDAGGRAALQECNCISDGEKLF
jgi:hypothetical protein